MSQTKAQVSWYNSARWHRTRYYQLQAMPLCAMCLKQEVITPAAIVDHITPHRGNYNLFWFGPLQSLCKLCHDSRKQRMEGRAYSKDIGDNGWPIDPRHPSNTPPRIKRTSA